MEDVKAGRGRFRAVTHLVFVVCLVLSLFAVALPAGAAPIISNVHITDVRDSTFVMSWTTNEPSDGIVEYGTTPALGATAVDPVPGSTTHHVVVSAAPGTTYLVQVRSGTTVDDNSGAFYVVTTGPTILTVPGPTIWGQVLGQDGATLVPNAIVYLWITDIDGLGTPGDSQIATSRTDASGFWFYALANLRTPDALAYYVFNQGADQLSLVVQGGAAGALGELTDSGATDPFITPLPIDEDLQLPDLVLGAPTAVQMTGLAAQIPPALSLGTTAAVGLLVIGVAISLHTRERRRIL